MPKRTLAALCALLAFMAVLAVVPLATAEPAEAHPKTKQRCDFDPLSGLSFNCRSVSVSHTHRDPSDQKNINNARDRNNNNNNNGGGGSTDPSDQKNINNASVLRLTSRDRF